MLFFYNPLSPHVAPLLRDSLLLAGPLPPTHKKDQTHTSSIEKRRISSKGLLIEEAW